MFRRSDIVCSPTSSALREERLSGKACVVLTDWFQPKGREQGEVMPWAEVEVCVDWGSGDELEVTMVQVHEELSPGHLKIRL